MIDTFVTKSFLPPKEEYLSLLDLIWESNQLTNNGTLLKRFESQIKNYLDVPNFQFVTNGTLALQLAISGLGIEGGEIITTPFSYVATTNAILWQHCKPVFVDIDPKTLCIDPAKIESAITQETRAIMPVHVFGNACDIKQIEKIAAKHELKIIYDAAHAFGSSYHKKSLLAYGDISICSFHATKIFHTIEGGGVVCNNDEVDKRINLQKRFGHNTHTHLDVGINAKASEFQAAMGICNLRYFEQNSLMRKEKWKRYNTLLPNARKQKLTDAIGYNYAYFPVIFRSESQLLKAMKALNTMRIYPRRYFYPSLNMMPYLENKQHCPISEGISETIICLPLWESIADEILEATAATINDYLD
jgi:dTDP-4-amino-4,6-dideoxygalactose transaminase